MGLVTPANVSIDTMTAQFSPQIAGLYAGEDLLEAAPCYVESDGLVYMSYTSGSANDARVHGWTPRVTKSGEPVTLFGPGTRFRYSTGLTPGNPLYLGTTAGRLDLTDTGDVVAFIVTATDIVVTPYIPVGATS
jgi:hypothetical protein